MVDARDPAVPTDPYGLVCAERDALKQDLADAEAEIARLGDQVWRLEHELLKHNPKQLDIYAEGTAKR